MAKARTPHMTPVSRKPFKVVVAGGFGSGKSTLINLLLREDVLERHVGFHRSPLLRLISADGAPTCHVTDGAGQRSSASNVGHALNTPNAVLVEQTATITALSGMEIVEFPSAEFGEINDEHIQAVADADLLIWCTIGSQAWRLSEKTALGRLREAFEGPVFLAVMRSDHFRNDVDREKVRLRLEREVVGLASEIVFLGASQSLLQKNGEEASRARIGADRLDSLVGTLKDNWLDVQRQFESSLDAAGKITSTNVIELIQPEKVVEVTNTQTAGDLATAVPDEVVVLSDVTSLLSSFQDRPGLLSIGVMRSQSSELVCGETPEYAPGLYAGLASLPGADAGGMENAIITTASGHLVFQHLSQVGGLVVVAKFKRQGVVISAEVSKMRRICEDWQLAEVQKHDA